MQRENLGNNNLLLPNKLSDIDWAHMWHQQMDEATFRGNGASFWDNWARSLPLKTEHSGYVEELISRLELTPDDTLLDVGAGTGALSIPLARLVRQVTSLDQSPAMLDHIMNGANRNGLANITPLHLDWAQIQVGRDFPQHDIVLVSRSLPSNKGITHNLRSIDAAAKRLCYITWKASGYDEIESELSTMLNIPYTPSPDYAVLYNLLLSMGIHANVELFRTSGRRRYNSIPEAYIQIVRSYPAGETEQRAIIEFLEHRLTYSDGYYYQQKNSLWSLIWWDKSLQKSPNPHPQP